MGRKIGIFGGTFDPVHIGHVALVVALQEARDLDLVLIIPANRSPHKENAVPQEAKHRLNMLKKAFKDLEYCSVLPLEIKRAGPSYTIDTVLELKALNIVNDHDTLYLILGQDQMENFNSWKNVQELMKQTFSLVARRKDTPTKNLSWFEKGMCATPYFEVSSTDIRNRIKKKLYCGHLLNNQVYNYIQRNKLYE